MALCFFLVTALARAELDMADKSGVEKELSWGLYLGLRLFLPAHNKTFKITPHRPCPAHHTWTLQIRLSQQL